MSENFELLEAYFGDAEADADERKRRYKDTVTARWEVPFDDFTANAPLGDPFEHMFSESADLDAVRTHISGDAFGEANGDGAAFSADDSSDRAVIDRGFQAAFILGGLTGKPMKIRLGAPDDGATHVALKETTDHICVELRLSVDRWREAQALEPEDLRAGKWLKALLYRFDDPDFPI